MTIRIPLSCGGTTWARVMETCSHAPAVVLAPGAGSDRASPRLVALQDALVAAGFTAVVFDFPYRSAGRKLPDRPLVLEACWRDVLSWVAERLEPRWIAAGGHSMGGRIASHVAAAGGVPLRGLVFLAFPLHPSGRPDTARAAHLARVTAPMLFVQGTHDALADRALLDEVLHALPHAVCHTIPGADHSFRVPKRSGRTEAEVTREITATVTRWLQQLDS